MLNITLGLTGALNLNTSFDWCSIFKYHCTGYRLLTLFVHHSLQAFSLKWILHAHPCCLGELYCVGCFHPDQPQTPTVTRTSIRQVCYNSSVGNWLRKEWKLLYWVVSLCDLPDWSARISLRFVTTFRLKGSVLGLCEILHIKYYKMPILENKMNRSVDRGYCH